VTIATLFANPSMSRFPVVGELTLTPIPGAGRATRMAGEEPWRPSPTTPLGACREWSMRMKCGLCDRVGTYRVDDLAAVYGGHHTVAEIVSRLRCQKCHRGSVDVQLVCTDRDGSSRAVGVPM
jgi:hypothetical protein